MHDGNYPLDFHILPESVICYARRECFGSDLQNTINSLPYFCRVYWVIGTVFSIFFQEVNFLINNIEGQISAWKCF